MQSLIYAAPRVEVKELQTVRALLAEKFGKEFALAASENAEGKVAERVLERLRVEPPKRELVDGYLGAIAEAYGVQWPRRNKELERAQEEVDAEDQGDDDDDEGPSGGQKIKAKALEAPLEAEELTKATPPRNLGPKSPVSVVPPSPSTDNVSPRVKLPGPPDLKPTPKMKSLGKEEKTVKKDSGGGPGGKIPDVDELAKRFAQLKR